jgi:hypothetical protein
MSRVADLRSWWHHAFAVESGAGSFTPEDHELVERLAAFVVRRGMTTPALMALESGRPLNFIGSQLLAFFGPLLTFVFSAPEYDRFILILGKRSSIDLIIQAIEKQAHGD